jgi:hypothetical protein
LAGLDNVTPPRAPREVWISPAIESCEIILAKNEGGIFFDSAIWLVAALWLGSSLDKYTIARNA